MIFSHPISLKHSSICYSNIHMHLYSIYNSHTLLYIYSSHHQKEKKRRATKKKERKRSEEKADIENRYGTFFICITFYVSTMFRYIYIFI